MDLICKGNIRRMILLYTYIMQRDLVMLFLFLYLVTIYYSQMS